MWTGTPSVFVPYFLAILSDREYEKMMKTFDEKLEKLTEDLFRKKYLRQETVNSLSKTWEWILIGW